MKYNKNKIRHFVEEEIPKGKIMTPALVAKAIGLNPTSYQRCVAKEICKCKEPEMYRIVLKLKSGWRFPHPNKKRDCKKRADFLRKEGISISEDNTRVLNAVMFLYNPG